MKKTLILVCAIILTNCGIHHNKSNKTYDLGKSIEKPYQNEVINDSEIYEFNDLKNIPRTNNCADTLGQEVLKQCVNKSISYFMNRKFNAGLASNLGLQSGKYTITTKFIINKNGEIINIESSGGGDPILNNEAKRVMNQIPQLKPGKINGKPVNVRYEIPLRFLVE